VTDERKIAWIVLGVVALGLVIVFGPGQLRRELRPDPVAALVAIQPAGEGAARTGRVELAAGTPFTLHAALEAKGLGGNRLFFTDAPALIVDGRRVDGDSLRPWPGPERAKILWFSVEGPRPFVELADDTRLEAFALRENYRSDWPRSWSIPGTVRPLRDVTAPGDRILETPPFGTLRFQVKIELFGIDSELVPVASYRSRGAAEALGEASSFPTVVAALDGPLALPSRVFGLTEIALPAELLRREVSRLDGWFGDDVAFPYLLLLRAMAEAAGRSWDDVRWQAVDLAAGPRWGEGAPAAGDLLRAGERIVVLYRDAGEEGVLDYEDLCLDFLEGPEVRRLEDVFAGEGLVEWTSLQGG
jgi:hypothetical protein